MRIFPKFWDWVWISLFGHFGPKIYLLNVLSLENDKKVFNSLFEVYLETK